MKQLLVILLLLGAIVGVSFWYYRTRFHPEVPVEVTVEKVVGQASRDDGGGTNLPLTEGERVHEGTRIRTGQGGTVRLGVQEGEQVELLDGSELVIRRVAAEGVNFELKQGRVEARVKRFRDREHTLTVGVTGNPAAVRTKDGAFSVVSDGWGSMDVAAKSGDVEMVARPGGTGVPIPVGERRVVSADGDQVLAGQVPRSVLLKVDWPEGGKRRKDTIEVGGTVTPGSRVNVDGQIVRPGKDGKFKATVKLREGANRVEVQASGMGEPARAESPSYTVDTSPPRVNSKTDEIWK